MVIVLWAVVLLAGLATNFVTSTRTAVLVTHNLEDNTRARSLADAGIYRALLALLHPNPTGNADGIENVSDTPRSVLPDTDPDQQWHYDGTQYPWEYGGGTILISIQAESGKIDLNTADQQLIEGLFVSVGKSDGEASAFAAAIEDFRNGAGGQGGGIVVAKRRRSVSRPYAKIKRPFELAGELQQVEGMTRSLYGEIMPALTVYSSQHGIDPKTAPREALVAFQNLKKEDLEDFITTRSEKNGQNIKGLDDVRSLLAGPGRPIYTLRAEAQIEGATFIREAIIEISKRGANPYQIYVWKQGVR